LLRTVHHQQVGGGSPSRLAQPAHQGLAHPSAPDDHQLPAHGPDATGRAPQPEKARGIVRTSPNERCRAPRAAAWLSVPVARQRGKGRLSAGDPSPTGTANVDGSAGCYRGAKRVAKPILIAGRKYSSEYA
jgi:hypothetical protein